MCPVHGTPLIYWPHGDDHACQDVECRYGRGVARDVTIRTYPVEGGYVVADNGVWVPGLYPTREAAVEAARNMAKHGTVEQKDSGD